MRGMQTIGHAPGVAAQWATEPPVRDHTHAGGNMEGSGTKQGNYGDKISSSLLGGSAAY